MIKDQLIPLTKWAEAWLWFRAAPHQMEAVFMLYSHILELPGGDQLLNEHAEWFARYQDRDKLVRGFMHPEGE